MEKHVHKRRRARMPGILQLFIKKQRGLGNVKGGTGEQGDKGS